ncbi:MAG: ABC transporter ATP-binding protein [Bacilli bacterium]|nr:ABC transporter ATP-binding protein [Bacilli bacterium]
MEEKKPIISVKDLVVKFKVRDKNLTAIRNVSLDLYEGETLAIVGESGSGKSVLTKTFTGMLESNGWVDSGEITFEGENLALKKKNREWLGIRGKKIATVFQDPMTSLNPLLSIGSQISEVVRLHQGLNKEEAKAKAIELLKRVGINDAERRFKDKPYQYSGGMRQRVVIAIALACHPKILICDEPTTALDVTIQSQILQLIKDLQKEYGFSTIYITHDLGVVANVADRVCVMYAGQIIEYGLVDEIFYNSKHPYTWSLLSSLPQLGIKGEKLYAITGTPPSLQQEIIGDAFASRNPFALEIDFKKEPPMFQVSETHFAKTWLLDPRAPKVEMPKTIQNLKAKVENANAINIEAQKIALEEKNIKNKKTPAKKTTKKKKEVK